MIKRILFLFTSLLSVFLFADINFPAKNWVDRVDPMASPYAVKGGTFRFNGGQSPKSYNAYIDNNTYTHTAFGLMYETLISTDPETLEFVPCLAKKWTVSDDGCTFTFEIDPEAKWSDGVPVTAEDVKWTFDTILDPKSDAGAYIVILSSFHSPEIITNANETVHRTIRFRSKSNKREWRSLLNCGTFEIMPRHALEGKNFTAINFLNTPVSGPYKLTRIDEQFEVEFTRRNDWWYASRPSAQYVYNFDKIVFRYYSDNENAFEAFKKKKIDLYPVYSAHLMVKGTKGKLFDRRWIKVNRVTNQKPMGFQGFVMNMRKFPFDDIRVRKALALLLDRETMNKTIMYSEYEMSNSYYPDLYDSKNPCKNKKWPFDPAEAKKLLKEAGWVKNEKTGFLEKDGKPFQFTFLSRMPGEDKFLALYNESLKDAGIKMDIVRKDFASWMRDMDKFNFEMSWAAWGASIFKNMEPLWGSKEADHDGGNNLTGFKSEEADRLINLEKGEFSVEKRMDYYRQMDSIFAANMPYILLWNTSQTRLLYWNKFGMPKAVLGKYGTETAAVRYWWYDEDAAEELEEAISSNSFLP